MGHYTGWALREDERLVLLKQFPPHYSDVIAHHITLDFGVDEDHPLPEQTRGFIVGVADDDTAVQALVVEIDGTTDRPDGSTFHITWSINRAGGAKPVHSNDVVKNGWEPVERTVVTLVPKMFG